MPSRMRFFLSWLSMRVLFLILCSLFFTACNAREPIRSNAPRQTLAPKEQSRKTPPAPPTPSPFVPQRLLLVGDSFVSGFSGMSPSDPNPTGLRSELWRELQSREVALEFVGTRENRSLPGLPARHEGYPGETIAQITSRLFDKEKGTLAQILLSAPSLSVVLWAGYNDAFAGPIELSQYSGLVSRLLAEKQVRRVVVANLVCNAHPTRDGRHRAFNGELKRWVSTHPSKRLRLADVASVITCPDNLVDGLHLTSQGDETASKVILRTLFEP